jgi:hypothetical protein
MSEQNAFHQFSRLTQTHQFALALKSSVSRFKASPASSEVARAIAPEVSLLCGNYYQSEMKPKGD